MFAVAKGFAGVRAYGYDSTWAKASRQNDPIGSQEQTFSDPFQVGVARWQAMSAAFNLIQNLLPYVLQPQTHAIDLGRSVFTGAKDGPNGRLVIAINSLEVNQTIRADLKPYVYPNGFWLKRFQLVGATLVAESLPDQTNDTLILAPGEVVVWLILPAGVNAKASSRALEDSRRCSTKILHRGRPLNSHSATRATLDRGSVWP